MPTTTPTTTAPDPALGVDEAAQRAARHCVHEFLALAISSPHVGRWDRLEDPDLLDRAVAAAQWLRAEAGPADAEALAPGELQPSDLDLAPIADRIRAGREAIKAEFDGVFGLLTPKGCPPFETEYCPQTFSVYRSHQLADIAGYYRAFNLETSEEYPSRADHVSTELEFLGWLVAREDYAIRTQGPDAEGDAQAHAEVCRDAYAGFFEAHVCWWVPAFAFAMRRKGEALVEPEELSVEPCTFYGAVGHALSAWIALERLRLGVAPPTELLEPQAQEEPPECGGCD